MKAVIVHGLLAFFGLGLAFQTWARKPEDEAAPGSVVVLECSADGVEKLNVTTPTNEFSVEPKRDRGEASYWITSRSKTAAETKAEAAKGKDKDKKDAGAAEAKADPAEGESADKDKDKDKAKDKETPEAQKPKRFLANGAFADYLKRYTPLRALRSLGKLPKEKDADFGFDKVGTYLKFQCAGQSVDFEVGSRAFGASQRYLRETKSHTTYLFDEQVISDMESSGFKFMQADLHSFDKSEVEEITIEARGAKKKLQQRDRKSADQAVWVDSAEPTKRNELFNNWTNRLGRMRARLYLPESAEPGSDLKSATGGTESALTVEYKVAGKPNGKLELVRVDENGVAHYYVRTETTRNWVAVYDSMAKDVEQDVGMVLGIDTAPSKAVADKVPGTDARGGNSVIPPGHPAVPNSPHGPIPPHALPSPHAPHQ